MKHIISNLKPRQRSNSSISLKPKNTFHAGPKILLIDDDADFLFNCKHVLENLHYTVWGAMNIQAVEESGYIEEPDLILLDLHLPEEHGFSALLKLKSRFPFTPIYFLTNNENELSVRLAAEVGADGYLFKSDMSPATLKRWVDRNRRKMAS